MGEEESGGCEGRTGKSGEEECARQESGGEEGDCEEDGPSPRAGCGRACRSVEVPWEMPLRVRGGAAGLKAHRRCHAGSGLAEANATDMAP